MHGGLQQCSLCYAPCAVGGHVLQYRCEQAMCLHVSAQQDTCS